MNSLSKVKEEITIEELLAKTKNYIESEEQIQIIGKAYEFAKEKHKGQVRKTGEDYIEHPLHVAFILVSIYADYETICAGLLHDVLCETDCTEEEIEKQFGEDITRLVIGVTKLSKIHFSTENDYLIDYYKKIVVGMSQDVRVIIVKLADCLHNMRTLWALPEERQKVKAHEALDILVPIAHHLGIHKIKSELEDLALRYLKPDVFYDIAEKLNKTKLERDKTVYDMQEEVSSLLTEHHIAHEIKGRAKSIYSIFNKLDKGRKFSDIYDLLALRILVKTEQECYLALGLIHSKFRPLPNRFKDYIAMPKPNMYQSLHTTVFGIDGYLFEIQLRTYEMDEIAENGIASHWSYKENGSSKSAANLQTTTEQKLQFFKSIMDLSHEKMSNEEFVSGIQEEVLNNSIYCFTPKGDVIELPRGATPLDFAYKIHSKIGETTVGAIVNNGIVPLDYELQDGDIVKINTNKNATPSKEWIHMVKSPTIRNKIKGFFTKNDKEIYQEQGKYMIEHQLRKRKIAFADFFTEENSKKICANLKLDTIDDVYLSVGNGKLTPNGVINIIDKQEEEPVPKTNKPITEVKDTDIIVNGIDKVKVNLANCCHPVYGDEIIGYITKGNGITIHRINCHNVEMLEDRTLEVSWNQNQNKHYLTNLLIYGKNEENHMLDIIQTISGMSIAVEGIKVLNKERTITYELSCYVSNLEQLEKIILSLNKNHYIEKVEREIQ
ncbi:MAG: bifunctional (p)ppGpp synthetase/guanosine-3',5'-bis(diphosphate) 3'-pyrophosphohydrolase [Bacilli bacterium]|nr:bifunctional (p)ppGpp synthetase/guanosine-3',5'-bis(diphosphate) 3'-pyrophosphohydrolase [Bacilli bacterium]